MRVDASEAAFLLSPRGSDLLRAAREVRALAPLARRAKLDAIATPDEARAALAQDALRVRAGRKTPLADRLLFTKEALEQASPCEVADDRAERFRGFASVADLGAGIGLDTIALAGRVARVIAVERDPVRAALLRHNVAAAGAAHVEVVEGDALEHPPQAEAAFLDPDRRPDARRTRDPEAFAPPASRWSELGSRYDAMLIKLAPGARDDDGPAPPSEWVSLHGEMREARGGLGAFARADGRRRAVLLPGSVRLEGRGVPWPAPRALAVGSFLLDPDPALVVAGLLGDAALAIGAAPVHPRIAYLVADAPAPFATSIRVDAITPTDAAALRRMAEEHDVGAVEVRTRGVEGGAEDWRRRIRPRGRRPAVVVITRGADDRYLACFAFSAASAAARPSGESGLT